MTKTTNEPNEIICTCGHAAPEHDYYGCNHVNTDSTVRKCRCDKSDIGLIRSRLSTLEAAVEEQMETIKKLRIGLLSYERDHASDEYEQGIDAGMDFPPDECDCGNCRATRRLLAETAPKVQL